MPWFKVDDGFHGHPKVIELSLPAVGVWTLAGSWCANYLTDGQISMRSIRRLGGDEPEAIELVEADLWRDLGDGNYQFKDWEDYQPLKESVESEREAARERMQAVRAKKKGSSPKRSEDVQANNTGTFADDSAEVRVTPSRPSQPDPEGSKEPSPDAAKKPATKIPTEWAPTAKHITYGKENRIDVLNEAENFKLHAETHDRRAASWNGAFSTWLKKAKPSPSDAPGASPWSKEFHQ